jgi:glycosyltransferase involved in cell wall biosynthesis
LRKQLSEKVNVTKAKLLIKKTMKVFYYTAPPFLDTAIEIINILKTRVELHVVIEIAPTSKSSTILDVALLPEKPMLISPGKLLSEDSYQKMKPYLDGVASIYFAVHPHDNGLSFSTWKASQLVLSHVRKIKPDIIHIDAKSLRFITMAPYLYFFKKVYTTIHDPIPHSGEDHLKARLIRFLSLGVAKNYFFYSKFAHDEFKKIETANKKTTWQLRLFPITFFRKYSKKNHEVKVHNLFFGRLSPYKGIDVLMDAIPIILGKYPNEKFVVAGKSIDGYQIDLQLIEKYKDNIVLLNRYISNEELVDLFTSAKMVLCPYKDATQSGVLVTALALDVPVIASRVGAFPEYINENKNGLSVPVNDASALADAVTNFLDNDKYKTIASFIKEENKHNQWENNIEELLKAYNN